MRKKIKRSLNFNISILSLKVSSLNLICNIIRTTNDIIKPLKKINISNLLEQVETSVDFLTDEVLELSALLGENDKKKDVSYVLKNKNRLVKIARNIENICINSENMSSSI